MDTPARTGIYAAHIRTELEPAVQSIQQIIAQVTRDVAEYQDLARRLGELERAGGGPQDTLVELGAGVFVDARIANPSVITLDVGFDIHLDLPLPDARSYAQQRAELLSKRRDLLEQRVGRLRREIEQFQGAAGEASATSGAAGSGKA